MNIDGATAVVFAELGFAPPLCRGLFVLSRSVGVLAHAWEQMQPGEPQQGADAAPIHLALHRPRAALARSRRDLLILRPAAV